MKKLSFLLFTLLSFVVSLEAQQERNSDPGDIMWESFGESIDLLMENMDSIMNMFIDGQEFDSDDFQLFKFDNNFMSEDERQYFEREMEKWSLDFDENIENYMQEFEKNFKSMESRMFDLELWEKMQEKLFENLGQWHQGDQIEEKKELKEEQGVSQDKKLKKI